MSGKDFYLVLFYQSAMEGKTPSRVAVVENFRKFVGLTNSEADRMQSKWLDYSLDLLKNLKEAGL